MATGTSDIEKIDVHESTGLTGDIIKAEVRASDQYFNATKMCQTVNKRWNNYYRNKQTQEYLLCLESNTRIRAEDLVETKIGGMHEGSWVHRRVAIHLAQWLSPEFACFVTDVIDKYMTHGQLALEQQKTEQLRLEAESADRDALKERYRLQQKEEDTRKQQAIQRQMEAELEIERLRQQHREQEYPDLDNWHYSDVKETQNMSTRDTFGVTLEFISTGMYAAGDGMCMLDKFQKDFLKWSRTLTKKQIDENGFMLAIQKTGGVLGQAGVLRNMQRSRLPANRVKGRKRYNHRG